LKFKSGFVSIIGSPNAGKSTLLNALLGEKIAAVSAKPQTTRTRITGVLTDADSQIILLDTPGILKPKNKLGDYMKTVTEQTAAQGDIFLYMLDVSNFDFQAESSALQGAAQSIVILALNKIDKIQKEKLLPIISAFKKLKNLSEIVPLSAKKEEGIDILLGCIKKYLPEGPKYFPDDIISDQPEKQICGELVREKLMRYLGDEIPYGTTVFTEKMIYDKVKDFTTINCIIYCERQSHKKIIVGKEGATLKKIGSAARLDLEKFLGGRVFLQLWVKVSENWRNSDLRLKDFGYTN